MLKVLNCYYHIVMCTFLFTQQVWIFVMSGSGFCLHPGLGQYPDLCVQKKDILNVFMNVRIMILLFPDIHGKSGCLNFRCFRECPKTMV